MLRYVDQYAENVPSLIYQLTDCPDHAIPFLNLEPRAQAEVRCLRGASSQPAR